MSTISMSCSIHVFHFTTNTMRKVVRRNDSSAEHVREIVAPSNPKLLSSSLINKMINELAEYQIQSNEC